jgi:chaperonin GroEL
MRNKIIFGQDMEGVKKGMDMVHKAVTGTIGAAGKNVMFRDWSREPVITNDGYTIAEMINPEDEAESIGADFMKQASRRQNSEAGDGTSSVIAITHAMIEKGMEKLSEGANAMKLKREMVEAVNTIIPKLRKSAHKVSGDKELFDVANLSMENPENARIVVDAVKNCGESGRVMVQESNAIETYIEEIKGIEFGGGHISPYMITDPIKQQAVLEDVPVLVADKEFNMMKQLFPIMEGLKLKGIDKLLIVCRGVIGEALGNMIANIEKGTFLCVAVRLLDDPELMEDIAIMTGATKINEINSPDALTSQHIEYLGKVKRVTVTRERTQIDSGYGKKSDIKERIESLKNDIKSKEKDGIVVNKEKARLAQLDGKIIYIRVGAPTQQEMKYTKLKVDDAVASTLAAKRGGVVVGGGRALYDISQGKSTTDGEDVVKYACCAPIHRIIENAKKEPNEILGKLKEGQAWNSLTEKPVVDYIKEGIIDPVDIEVWALKNAVSTATGYLTSFAAIVNIPPKTTSPQTA